MSYGVPILVNIEILHGSLKALICLLITEYLNRLVLCVVSQSRVWGVLQPSPALNALSPNPVCQQETPETIRPEPEATEAATSAPYAALSPYLPLNQQLKLRVVFADSILRLDYFYTPEPDLDQLKQHNP
jgi:hypothetical protein